MGNISDMYCLSRPAAFAASAVVIRHMMEEMLSVSLFSKTVSK